jgi:AcrR family transcriptional regulator
MPREEVEKFRNRILDIALDIILKEGFGSLSIRKIASRLGVTATTIYNYYTNKDELNLMIRVRGFETLHAMLKKESDRFTDNMEEQFGAMIRAYVDFGLTRPGYYDLMFNLRTPKYLDYVGTEMEATARFEKQTAHHRFSRPGQRPQDRLCPVRGRPLLVRSSRPGHPAQQPPVSRGDRRRRGLCQKTDPGDRRRTGADEKAARPGRTPVGDNNVGDAVRFPKRRPEGRPCF